MTSFISPNLSQNFDVFSIIIDIKVMWFVESVNCSEFVDRSFSMAASSQVDGFPALSITSVSVTNSLQEWGRRRGAICPQNFGRGCAAVSVTDTPPPPSKKNSHFSRPVSYLLAKFSPIFRPGLNNPCIAVYRFQTKIIYTLHQIGTIATPLYCSRL